MPSEYPTGSRAPKPQIGFIGQGWIGKNYADSFEDRGFPVTRYAKEKSFAENRAAIAECDIVFIAVPTPTTPKGFDDSIVREVIALVGKGKAAVIKSTVTPGTTAAIQKDHPGIVVLHNPEFLREAHARYDVDHPDRTIVGMGADTPAHRAAAEALLAALPKAPYELITDAMTAEFVKYTHNTMGYSLVLFANILYDAAAALGVPWEPVKESILHNPWIPEKYLDPVHKGGRGAGGHCFIKDFAAFRALYETKVADSAGLALLRAYEAKNAELLAASGKDLDLLEGVYGAAIVKRKK